MNDSRRPLSLLVDQNTLPSLFPGTPAWSDADSAALRQFLISPTGIRFSRRILFERPEVTHNDGERRRIQQDERTGFETAVRTVYELASPAVQWDAQAAELAAQQAQR